MRALSFLFFLDVAGCSSDAARQGTAPDRAAHESGGAAGTSTSEGGSAGLAGNAGATVEGGADLRPRAVFAQSSLPRDALGADPNAVANVVQDDTAFAFDLYGKLRTDDENLFFCPLSVTLAMGMAWVGAVGKTADEIQSVFHFEDQDTTHAALGGLELALGTESDAVAMRFANALWILPSIEPGAAFLDVLGKHYGAGVGLVDFNHPDIAAATIDRWVSERTLGTIDHLLSPEDLPAMWTAAVLTNAAYFHGKWEDPFDTSDTTEADFTGAAGTVTHVKTMRSQVPRRYVKSDGYQAVALPYQGVAGHHFEMIAVLPDAALSALEPIVDAAWLDALLAGMRTTPVDLALPRFAFRSPLKLKDALSALGMATAFESGKGDFSGIAAAIPPLHLLEVVHEGFIDVNELGTAAGAATAVIIAKDGGISEVRPVELRFDRPFMILLRHLESGSVVFMGRVAAP